MSIQHGKISQGGTITSALPGDECRNLDRAAVAACRRGDAAQFRRLFDTYRDAGYRVALGVVGRPDDALDVCQDAFIKAFQNLDRFDEQRPFAPWFLRIVRNTALDLLRGRRRFVEQDEDDGDEAPRELAIETRTPEEEARNVELSQAFDRALRALGPDHRETLLLRERENLQYDEIAEVTGVPRGTVMSRLFYARKALRRELEAWL
ncbi:MAG: sigma-70 family RNA polymerase sigma factor [Candidatus Schekmanbacteria bacterium]|nr:sigma-70 family RNA polymerase sigma factor [Candidatus Schekmanbacteria bacterium]